MLSNTFISFLLACKEEKIPENQPGTAFDLTGKDLDIPQGWPAVLEMGRACTILFCSLRGKREGFFEETLLVCVPVAVCHR